MKTNFSPFCELEMSDLQSNWPVQDVSAITLAIKKIYLLPDEPLIEHERMK